MLGNQAIVQRTFRAVDHGVAVIAFIGWIVIVDLPFAYRRDRPGSRQSIPVRQRKQNDNPTSGFTHIDCPLASSSLPCASSKQIADFTYGTTAPVDVGDVISARDQQRMRIGNRDAQPTSAITGQSIRSSPT
jgi:hypothetical protein